MEICHHGTPIMEFIECHFTCSNWKLQISLRSKTSDNWLDLNCDPSRQRLPLAYQFLLFFDLFPGGTFNHFWSKNFKLNPRNSRFPSNLFEMWQFDDLQANLHFACWSTMTGAENSSVKNAIVDQWPLIGSIVSRHWWIKTMRSEFRPKERENLSPKNTKFATISYLPARKFQIVRGTQFRCQNDEFYVVMAPDSRLMTVD